MTEHENLLAKAQYFVDCKYVARADERQKSMGLAYVEAERQDLAREIVSFTESYARSLPGLAQTAGHWAIQESVPSDGFECYFLLRDGITVAEICGPQSDQRLRDLSDLVSAANASASGGDAVAWTNEAQLGFLKDPTCADIPMAMWAKHGRAATIPLYTAPQQSPRLDQKTLANFLSGYFPGKQATRDRCAAGILALLSPDPTVVSSTNHAAPEFTQCARCWQPATCKKYGCSEPVSSKVRGAVE